MKIIIHSFLVVIIFNLYQCTLPESNIEKDNDIETSDLLFIKSKKEEVTLDTQQFIINYNQLLSRIYNKRKEIKYNNTINREEKIAQAKQLINNFLLDSIISYWYHTPWDFNGYSDKPRVGYIACGYLVSTPIRHLNFKINRYKIAQKAAKEIVEKLCLDSSIKTFYSIDKLEQYMKNYENDVLILGLNNHVGFATYKNNESYFIHSSYTDEQVVVKEKLKNSAPISYSDIYVIGNFTQNERLIENWLNQ